MAIKEAVKRLSSMIRSARQRPDLLVDPKKMSSALVGLKEIAMQQPELLTQEGVRNFLSHLESVSDNAEHAKLFNKYSFKPALNFDQINPDSPEFLALQMQQYKEISGRDGYFPIRDERDSVFEFTNQFTVYPFTTQDVICTGNT